MSRENNLYLCIEDEWLCHENPFAIIAEGNNSCCENPLVIWRETTPSWKIFVIFVIIDKIWPGHKTFLILNLTVLDMPLYVVAALVMSAHLYDAFVIAHGLWMGFSYWYIYVYFFITENKMTSSWKNILLNLVMHLIYLLYRRKRRQLRKPLFF